MRKILSKHFKQFVHRIRVQVYKWKRGTASCYTSKFLFVNWSGKRDSNPRPPAWKASALSTELFPQNIGYRSTEWNRLACRSPRRNQINLKERKRNTFSYWLQNSWGEQDSNLRRHKSAELQSAPVGRFGISPSAQRTFAFCACKDIQFYKKNKDFPNKNAKGYALQKNSYLKIFSPAFPNGRSVRKIPQTLFSSFASPLLPTSKIH